MINYEVAPEALRDLVPAGTSLDLWQGRALVSVVGFRFLNTRLLGLPVPFHRDFDEVNLRFYVRREVDGEVRRGVTFVRELVPRRAIALIARLAYNEPYSVARMRSTTPAAPVEQPGRIEYAWSIRGTPGSVAATTIGAPSYAAADSEATFITEHYWGYTRQRDGGTVEYQVTHPRWRVWAVTDPVLTADSAALYGPRFGALRSAVPVSAFVADGSDVVVHRPARIAARR